MTGVETNPEAPAKAGLAGRGVRAVFGLFLAAYAVLLWGASRGDLWLDEIWSLSLVSRLEGASDILLQLKHDNNHPLNSLYLYWVGLDAAPWVYRWLSNLSGLGALAVAAWETRRRWGRPEAVAVTVLMAGSFPLLLQFSEARGYAPAVIFSIAAFALAGDGFAQGGIPRRAAYGVCLVLGLLAHLTSVFVLASLLLWQLGLELRRSQPRHRGLIRLLAWQAFPVIFLAGWYLYFVRGLTVGGGPELFKWLVVADTAALFLGLPDGGAAAGLALVLGIILLVAGVALLCRARDEAWEFFAWVLLGVPVTVMLVMRPDFLYFRYFLVCLPFLHLLLARGVGLCWRHGGRSGRILAVALPVLLVAGHLPRTVDLLRLGRGDYLAAVQYLMSRADAGPVKVGSDHDFRNPMLLWFYGARVPGGERLQYVPFPRFQEQPPDWIFTHRAERHPETRLELKVDGVGRYELERSFPYCGYSGWTWFLYRRADQGGLSLK